ncbi:MAG TPA: SRPBCC family protein [Candidatus Limnocylindrales bacterium]|nr:SRPBCC family protein [Candidatus Limnocylindrales bacterium]
MLTTRLGTEWHPVAREQEVPGPGTYVLAQLGDESAIVVRCRDGILRAFHNVCKHRGSRVLEEPCGTVTRLQCPYHAWVYDLEGRLVRAKHTEDLEEFAFETSGLTPIDLAVADGIIHLRLQPAARQPKPVGLLTGDEIAAVRRPYRAASLLPGRAYHDAEIHDFERVNWFRRDWVCVGRVEDAGLGTAPFETELDGERLVISRDEDGTLRAQRPSSPAAPVHIAAWQGFAFVSFADAPPPIEVWFGDLVGHVERFRFETLRRGHRVVYDVQANWKLIVENYSECYHCPGIHPQLNRLTPYDVGADYETEGAWQGGWMELRDGFETMALDGAHRIGPPMCGITPTDERRIDYLVVWPNLLLSIHPDYLLVHGVEPLGVGRTRITCDWLFEPGTMAAPGFDPLPAIEFWDVTNRQDWHVCELQQRGTASGAFRAGRFATNEASVHAFDQMCADRYLGDDFVSQRTVRDRYDVPPPSEPRYLPR